MAIAGFAGIAVAISSNKSSSPEKNRLAVSLLQNVLGAAFITLGLALFPAMLIETGVQKEILWRLASAVAASLLFGYMLVYLPGALRRYRAAGERVGMLYLVNSILSALVVVAMVLVCIGYLPAEVYLVGPFFTTYAACVAFVRVFNLLTMEVDA